MPNFSNRDVGRIKNTVKRVEGYFADNSSPPGSPASAASEVPVTFINTDATDAPAYAILAVTDATLLGPGTPCLKCAKPASDSKLFAVNGPKLVSAGAMGQCYTSGWVKVLYGTGTPAVGQRWGGKASQWTAASDGDGCLAVFGVLDATAKLLLARLGSPHRAQMICGTLGGALTTTTASQTITAPVSMDGGSLPSGTITGYNVYTTKGFAGPSGGRCVAAWNQATEHYELIDVECV